MDNKQIKELQNSIGAMGKGGLNIGQGPFLTITFNASTEPDPSKIGWIARLPLQVVLCKEVSFYSNKASKTS